MNRITEYECGLRLVTNELIGSGSAVCTIAVGTGSDAETVENNGISHFTEHVMFKGTDRLSAKDIAVKFDGLGAISNAFTSREITGYYYKSIDETFDEAFALLSEILLFSVFPEAEIDRERKVIQEEIGMTMDEAAMISSDLLLGTCYSGSPLGLTILGPRENVDRFKSRDVKEYVKSHYCPDNTVISIAGCIRHERAEKLVEKYFLPFVGKKRLSSPTCFFAKKTNFVGGYAEYVKNFEQCEVAIGFSSDAVTRRDIIRDNLIHLVLGSGMSSRLFQAVREEKGLVYGISSYPLNYFANNGHEIDLSVSGPNLREALSTVREVIEKFKKEGITESEFKSAVMQYKCGQAYSCESNVSVSMGNAINVLKKGETKELAEIYAVLSTITLGEINAFLPSVLDCSGAALAVVGDGKYVSEDALVPALKG